MSEYLIQGETLTAIADAIRAKDGSTAQIAPGDMPDKIAAIETGGEDALLRMISGTLTTFSSDAVTEVSQCGFAYQTKLTSVSLPNAIGISSEGFLGCRALTSINFPSLKQIGYRAFRYCPFTEFITTESFNSRLDTSTFENCDNLQKVDFYHINSVGISNYALAAKNLVTAIFRQTDYVPTAGNAIFGGNTTKMNNGEGYIYVPASMVDAYKAAKNWSTYADQIRAIEDYPEIVG